MNGCRLVKPDATMNDELIAYRETMQKAGSSMDGTGTLRDDIPVSEWLEDNRRMENSATVPQGKVAAEQFVYLREEDNRIVGMIQYRHTLNDHLAVYGGHIGYSVRSDERRKGYAKRMLAECLSVCRASGLKRALLTCHKDNEGSRRTMLANGGMYESTVYYAPEDAYLERYWFEL